MAGPLQEPVSWEGHLIYHHIVTFLVGWEMPWDRLQLHCRNGDVVTSAAFAEKQGSALAVAGREELNC